ncbi:MAG: M20/M25/M40 family metallo-hydrolase [Pyrinomonadaceae bacterium]
MKRIKILPLGVAIFALFAGHLFAQSMPIQELSVRAHMEFLASDEMNGRGSGTEFEKLAGVYLASEMRKFGIEPAGDKDAPGLGAYIQTVSIQRSSLGNTTLNVGDGKSVSLNSLIATRTQASGAFKRVSALEEVSADSISLYSPPDGPLPRAAFGALTSSKAKAIILVAGPEMMKQLAGFMRRGASMTRIEGTKPPEGTSIYVVKAEDATALADLADGTEVSISTEVKETTTTHTWNSVGVIRGSEKNADSILLSAHMDHLGMRENVSGDDKIFNGADDDASGCVAVIELARVLASGPKPKRNIYFAFFGSEEAGGFGSKYFVETLPFPLEKLVANLQFEMLGRPDEKVAKDQLWLTGFDRSDLGEKLAKNGANLVADPHPEQNFFERSDNITLARKGVVAHTVSSYGLHKDYHQVTDEIGTIDFAYMTNAINSMVKPIGWLANTNWKPTWKEGMRP